MIAADCATCGRELLLRQLTDPVEGFRCPFCGTAFAPSYATIAPRTTAQLLNAHGQFVAALGELEAMTEGRLRLRRDTLVEPIDERLAGERPPGASDSVASRPRGRPSRDATATPRTTEVPR